MSPRDPRAITLVGLALTRASNSNKANKAEGNERAKRALKKALALDTGALRPLFALVDLYATDGEYETAIQLLKDGIESGGKVQNDNTHIGSGSTWNKAHIDVIYAKMGEVHTRYEDYGDALECYHIAMSLNPHNGLAQKGVEHLEKIMSGIDDEDGEMDDGDEMHDDDGEY